jgi:DNA polymerase-1
MLSELPSEARQLIQIHDEIVVEVPTELADQTALIMKHCMEESTPLNTKLLTDPVIVNNWMEAK